MGIFSWFAKERKTRRGDCRELFGALEGSLESNSGVSRQTRTVSPRTDCSWAGKMTHGRSRNKIERLNAWIPGLPSGP